MTKMTPGISESILGSQITDLDSNDNTKNVQMIAEANSFCYVEGMLKKVGDPIPSAS